MDGIWSPPPTGRRKKVLAIGMFDSIHFSQWLEIFKNEEIDFLLFPSSPHRKLHSSLKRLLGSPERANYQLAPFTQFIGLPLWVLDKLFSNYIRSRYLLNQIRRFRPDIIHALELQNAGYIASKALMEMEAPKPIFIATNYGSDIFWFSRFSNHRRKLSELLRQLDRYACECDRDVRLAKDMGFGGVVLKVQPNAGGFTEAQLAEELTEPGKRRMIMIKGYQGWVGRASQAVKALYLLEKDLRDFEIVFYSCNQKTRRLSAQLRRRTGLNLKSYPKGFLSHQEMLDMFSRSLIYVGLSLSDGISTSMLEAMAMGAIPVQTSSACCDEWFDETGVSIENLDAHEVAQGIKRAIHLALTTDSTAKNRETIRARAMRESLAKEALSFYRL